jgi:hypothetical protein
MTLNKEIEETSPLLSVEDCFSPQALGYDSSFDEYQGPDDPTDTTIYQICECPNPAKGMYLRNTVDGRKLLLNCNKYQCPYCGKFKARKLYAGMLKYFKQFEYIRL